jgi:hypothetical protein
MARPSLLRRLRALIGYSVDNPAGAPPVTSPLDGAHIGPLDPLAPSSSVGPGLVVDDSGPESGATLDVIVDEEPSTATKAPSADQVRLQRERERRRRQAEALLAQQSRTHSVKEVLAPGSPLQKLTDETIQNFQQSVTKYVDSD